MYFSGFLCLRQSLSPGTSYRILHYHYAEIDVRIISYNTGVCMEEKPLGMENGAIPNNRITASSYWDNMDNHGPWKARLNTQGM